MSLTDSWLHVLFGKEHKTTNLVTRRVRDALLGVGYKRAKRQKNNVTMNH